MSKPIRWTKKHRREALTRLFELCARYVMQHGRGPRTAYWAEASSQREDVFRTSLDAMGLAQADIDREVRTVNEVATGTRVRTLSYGVRAAPKRRGLSWKASSAAMNAACARQRARRPGKPWTRKEAHRIARECGGTVLVFVRRERKEPRR
jgi:hypothetical protein